MFYYCGLLAGGRPALDKCEQGNSGKMREALPLRRARRGAVLAATTLVMAVVLVSGSPYHFDGTGVAGRVCRMEHFFADEVYPVDGDVTAALRAALIACARDPERGIEAGTVVVGPGNHTTAPFNLTSGVNLLLEAGATLFGSRQIEDYPLIAPLPSYGVTRDSSTVPRFPAARFHPLVMAYKADDVSISACFALAERVAVDSHRVAAPFLLPFSW